MKEKETASTNVVVNPLRGRLDKPNENRSVQGELRLACGKLRGQVDGAGKKKGGMKGFPKKATTYKVHWIMFTFKKKVCP